MLGRDELLIFSMRFGNLDTRSVVVARAFFHAATKLSDDDEDILPQEDSSDVKLSVYGCFSELFPEHVVSKECGSITAKTGLTRLQFNKIGYEMYVKEQSRRVPAPRAKPGNPGYGFRRAKWRNVGDGAEDQSAMQETLQAVGLPKARCDYVRMRVDQFRTAWEQARRPSRPAGPGRPRGRARGDKTEDTSPEPAGTLLDSLPTGMPTGTCLGIVNPPPKPEISSWQYAHHLPHGGGARTQHGLNSPGVNALLAHRPLAQRPLASIQQTPSVTGGMSSMFLSSNVGNGGQWPVTVQAQPSSLPGVNWALGTGSSSPFSAGHMNQFHQQLFNSSASRLSSVGGEPKLFAGTDIGGISNILLSGLTPGLVVAGLGGCLGGQGGLGGLGRGLEGASNSIGSHENLSRALHVSAFDSPGNVPRLFGTAHTAKRVRGEERDDEEEAGEEMAAKGGRKRSNRVSSSKVDINSYAAATVRSSTFSSRSEGKDRSKDLQAPNHPKSQFAGELSSISGMASSASTCFANPPATRALDTVENKELAGAIYQNKASLTNLLTC